MPSWISVEARRVVVSEIVAARKLAGLSQERLAQLLGLSQSAVSQMEIGERRVDLLEFIDISKAVGRDPVEFFADIQRKVEGLPIGPTP